MILDSDAATSAAHPAARAQGTLKPDDLRYSGLPNYIFGLHDPGGEAHMLAAAKPGWVVESVEVNPPDIPGDFTALAQKGLGVIVCLNNGHGGAGTIPVPSQYARFALRCAQYAGRSKGAHIWIIGNAPNDPTERPGYDGGDNPGQVITPELYARCFNGCRKAIRALPGHENDWVIPAAVAPFSTQTSYPQNPTGDWVRYFADVLFQISAQRGALDGIALHTYTHGIEATLVMSEAMAGGSFASRHWHLRAYRDFMVAVPPALRNLPVFITEAKPEEPGWTSQNRTWIQTACAEINAWNANQANQPIQALCFFRWKTNPGDPPGWGMADKWEVVQDFSSALQRDYRVRWPGLPPKPDQRAEWVVAPGAPDKGITANEVITGKVVVKNAGAMAWLSTGKNAVRLGYRWFNSNGEEITLQPEAERFKLARNILPGQTAIVDHIQVRAPATPGTYTLKYDLVQQGDTWFGSHDSPTKDVTVAVIAQPWAVDWLQVIQAPDNAVETNTNLLGQVQARNAGSNTWLKQAPNPVRLGYRWYDSQGIEVAVVPYPGNFEMDADTPPGATATFVGVSLRSPRRPGSFSLVWDLLLEGAGWFSAKGAEINRQQILVTMPPPDLAAEWTEKFELPALLEPNETVSGSVSVRNTGSLDWSARGQNPVRLYAQWYDGMNNPIAAGASNLTFPLEHDVQRGASVTFEHVELRAPIPQGEYTLVFDLIKEGVTSFSAVGNRPHRLRVEVKTSAPDYSVQWVETVTLPGNSLISGEAIEGRIVVRNAGARMWNRDGENPIRVGYRWFDSTGQEAEASGNKVSLLQDVPPRESVIVDDVVLQAPDKPGDYTLRYGLVLDGVGWVEDGIASSAGVPITVEPPPLEWGADIISHNTPPSLAVGQETTVSLRIKNVGRTSWLQEGPNPVFVVYRWINAAGEFQADVKIHRTMLTENTPPGGTRTVAADLAAPLTPGAYRLEWDLVPEGLAAFSEGGNPALSIRANVTADPAQTNLWRAEASQSAASAHLAIDGDLDTSWSSRSNQVPGMWFRVEFGMLRLIDGISFRSVGGGYPTGYALRISSDGQTWRTVSEVPDGSAGDVIVQFAPEQVRYAQLELLAHSKQMWSISEVQVHLSPPWNATSSQNNDTTLYAIDNNPQTHWKTEQFQTPGMWFQLDLGRIENVTGLVFESPNDEFPLGYRVSVWNENTGGWQKITERRDNHESIDISFAPVRTQYLNIHLLQEAERPWAIRHVRVIKALTEWVGPSSG